MSHDTKKSKRTSTTRDSSTSPLQRYIRTCGTSINRITLLCELQKETSSYLCKTISGLEEMDLLNSGTYIPHLDQESFLQALATRDGVPSRWTLHPKSAFMANHTRKNPRTSRSGTAGSQGSSSSKKRIRRGGKRTGRQRPY